MKKNRRILYLLVLFFILIYIISIFNSGRNPIWANIKNLIPALGSLILVINLSPTLKRRWESFLIRLKIPLIADLIIDNATHKNDLRYHLLAFSERKCTELILENQRTVLAMDDFQQISISLAEYPSFQAFYKGTPVKVPQTTISTQAPGFKDGFFRYVLTGEAGHGKTFTLLKWMEECLGQKKALLSQDPHASPKIPVYIRLDTWSFEEEIQGYMAFALQNSYGMNLPEANWLVRNMQIIPFLDGLDEVEPAYQRECLHSIMHYARSNSVVFTCRKEVLDDIVQEGMEGYNDEVHVFLMQDLSRQTILQIIRSNPHYRTDDSIHTYIDNNGAILNNPTTSLMLSLFVQTFYTLQDQKALSSLDEQELLALLWKTYVDIKLNRDTQPGISYMLSMSDHMEGNTFFLDKIQPDWLSHRTARALYYLASRLVTGLVLAIAIGFIIATPGELIGNGLFASLLVTLLTWCVQRWEKDKPLSWARTVPLYCLVLSAFCGFYQGLVIKRSPIDMELYGCFSWTDSLSGITLGMIYGALFGYRKSMQTNSRDIQPLHLLRFDLKRSQLVGLRASLWTGVFIGVAAIAIRAVIPQSDFYSSIDNIIRPSYHFLERYCPFIPDIASEYIVFFIFGFCTAFVSAFIIFALMGARDKDRSYIPDSNRLKNKFILNYGIRRSTIIAIRSGFLGFLLFSFVYGIILVSLTWDYNRAVRSIMIGMGIGMIAFLWYGGFEVIQYWMLRIFLYMEGIFPFRFYLKLKQLRDKDLIRKEGSGLHFRHATLLEYFQSIPPTDPQRVQRYTHPAFKRIFLSGLLGLSLFFMCLPFAQRYLYHHFWTKSTNIRFTVDSSLLRRTNDTAFVATSKARLQLTIRGLIDVGTYTGYIGPEGTKIGFLGFPLPSKFNVDTSQPHGALLYRISNRAGPGPWSFLRYQKKKYFVYSRSRLALMDVNAGDTLAFLINDNEWENNSGHFDVTITRSNPAADR